MILAVSKNELKLIVVAVEVCKIEVEEIISIRKKILEGGTYDPATENLLSFEEEQSNNCQKILDKINKKMK